MPKWLKSFFELIGKIKGGRETAEQRVWKERFEAFMDNSPFIAWIKNSDLQHEYLSQPYEAQIGTPVKDWKGKSDYELWPKDVAESHRAMDVQAIESGEAIVFESTHPLPNGEVKNWLVVKFPFRVGGSEGQNFVGGIAIDVSEQRRAEFERDQFFETTSELMCIADSNRCFKRVNNAFTEILGFGREELLAKTFNDFVHPIDRRAMDNALLKAQPEDKFVEFETRYRCKDGSFRLISWSTPVSDIATDIFFAVGRDVTEQRSLERKLLRIADDEQRRIADDLHDGLGQELAGLAMMAESLALNLKDKDHPDAELANKIAVQLEASQQLTRNLVQGLRPVEIDSLGLKSALLQLAVLTGDRFGLECTFSCCGDVELGDAESATQLYRIAQEAVANAARHAKPKTIEIHLLEESGVLELKVIDDGCGIVDSEKNNSGIGMKSMRYRSDVIGGKLRVDSIDQGGTIVVCRLAAF